MSVLLRHAYTQKSPTSPPKSTTSENTFPKKSTFPQKGPASPQKIPTSLQKSHTSSLHFRTRALHLSKKDLHSAKESHISAQKPYILQINLCKYPHNASARAAVRGRSVYTRTCIHAKEPYISAKEHYLSATLPQKSPTSPQKSPASPQKCQTPPQKSPTSPHKSRHRRKRALYLRYISAKRALHLCNPHIFTNTSPQILTHCQRENGSLWKEGLYIITYA